MTFLLMNIAALQNFYLCSVQKDLFWERCFLLSLRWIDELEPVAPDGFCDCISHSASATGKSPSREVRPTDFVPVIGKALKMGMTNCVGMILYLRDFWFLSVGNFSFPLVMKSASWHFCSIFFT